MMKENWESSFLYGGNAPYIEEQYELYLSDAAAVPAEWRGYFDALRKMPAVDGTDHDDVAHAPIIDHFVALARSNRSAALNPEDLLSFARKQAAVGSLVTAYRMVGARKARLDPLQWTPTPPIPDLAPGLYGLTNVDMATTFSTAGTGFAESEMVLGDLVTALEKTYCGTLATEFMHLTDTVHRQWWEIRLESNKSNFPISPEKQRHILERLTAAEGLEKYLHARYVGQKRFSLEGGESLIVLLDELIQHGASRGIRSVVMGMAHRGRLNVLVNVIGKPPHALFDEFDGKAANVLPAGDVKYHKGFNGVAKTSYGDVELILASNPSHLEIVNPVVQGISRALSEQLDTRDSAVLPVEIHGDAAISGQGIVMETMNLSSTRGHGTGGTIHVVVNNQVGFTTSDPRDTRSTFFCTDIAKLIEAPVLHVNGDDPEAVVAAVQLAIDYRTTFKKSVVIDLVCFRRHGHQEQDTPNITQPLMYRAIAANLGARKIYARKLIDTRAMTAEQTEDLIHSYRDRLESAQSVAEKDAKELVAAGKNADAADVTRENLRYAPPPLMQLKELANSITEIPKEYSLHPLVAKVISSRREMATGAKALDWGMGEHLALASLLSAGIDVRLSGQDCERGTFTHRHAVLHNQNRESRSEGIYVPLRHIGSTQGKFSVTNSLLSESAVLGFEYGYSVIRPDALVMWEAQFGDFANGAQVVIDQFIASGAAKWGQYSGLTMLLPHGQEGQGPEHASARLERYLQLCAQNNMQVCQPTTPAQMFHLLRKQVLLSEQRPLIIMTPKSLLRHAEAVSSLEELAENSFQPVLGDGPADKAKSKTVTRAILCSGKVYYDLLDYRKSTSADDIALIRLEQLYPFPSEQLAAELARYSNLNTVVWCQEEPHNQGAWTVIESSLRAVVPNSAKLQYAGRAELASTAPGYFSTHAAQQKDLVLAAFTK